MFNIGSRELDYVNDAGLTSDKISNRLQLIVILDKWEVQSERILHFK